MKPKIVTYAHDTFTREKAREEKKWKFCVYAVAVVQSPKKLANSNVLPCLLRLLQRSIIGRLYTDQDMLCVLHGQYNSLGYICRCCQASLQKYIIIILDLLDLF